MIDWEITGITIQCEAVQTTVTVLIYKDSHARCTGYRKYYQNPSKQDAKALRQRGKKHGRLLKCEGLECSRIKEYKRKLSG